jgi:hypothetical protein
MAGGDHGACLRWQDGVYGTESSGGTGPGFDSGAGVIWNRQCNSSVLAVFYRRPAPALITAIDKKPRLVGAFCIEAQQIVLCNNPALWLCLNQVTEVLVAEFPLIFTSPMPRLWPLLRSEFPHSGSQFHHSQRDFWLWRLNIRGGRRPPKRLKINWRKRVRVERTDAGMNRRPPVLKNTEGVLNGYENFLLYLILQPLTNRLF